MAAFPAFALSLGCGDSNPPAQTPTLSQEQIAAEEKHHQEVSAAEKRHEKMLPKATYIPREEAAVNDVERAHEAGLRKAAHDQNAPSQRR
jgi:hypothetical protein